MKLSNSSEMQIIEYRQMLFDFELPSIGLNSLKRNFWMHMFVLIT